MTDRWYHCTGSLFGNWLPGDPRGWRSRNHRLHVPGDYRQPPNPATFAEIHARSLSLRHKPAVWLSIVQRRVVCRAWGEALNHYGLAFGEIAIGSRHWHLVFACADRKPKTWVGRLKAWSVKRLQDHGCRPTGTVWAQGCRAGPIQNEAHLTNTRRYIADHFNQGAAVWSQLIGEDAG